MTFVGLDLHKRYITACALDSSGALLGEVRRMPVSLEVLDEFLSSFPAPVAIGMEATLYWQCCTIISSVRDTKCESPMPGR